MRTCAPRGRRSTEQLVHVVPHGTVLESSRNWRREPHHSMGAGVWPTSSRQNAPVTSHCVRCWPDTPRSTRGEVLGPTGLGGSSSGQLQNGSWSQRLGDATRRPLRNPAGKQTTQTRRLKPLRIWLLGDATASRSCPVAHCNAPPQPHRQLQPPSSPSGMRAGVGKGVRLMLLGGVQ